MTITNSKIKYIGIILIILILFIFFILKKNNQRENFNTVITNQEQLKKIEETLNFNEKIIKNFVDFNPKNRPYGKGEKYVVDFTFKIFSMFSPYYDYDSSNEEFKFNPKKIGDLNQDIKPPLILNKNNTEYNITTTDGSMPDVGEHNIILSGMYEDNLFCITTKVNSRNNNLESLPTTNDTYFDNNSPDKILEEMNSDKISVSCMKDIIWAEHSKFKKDKDVKKLTPEESLTPGESLTTFSYLSNAQTIICLVKLDIDYVDNTIDCLGNVFLLNIDTKGLLTDITDNTLNKYNSLTNFKSSATITDIYSSIAYKIDKGFEAITGEMTSDNYIKDDTSDNVEITNFKYIKSNSSLNKNDIIYLKVMDEEFTAIIKTIDNTNKILTLETKKPIGRDKWGIKNAFNNIGKLKSGNKAPVKMYKLNLITFTKKSSIYKPIKDEDYGNTILNYDRFGGSTYKLYVNNQEDSTGIIPANTNKKTFYSYHNGFKNTYKMNKISSNYVIHKEDGSRITDAKILGGGTKNLFNITFSTDIADFNSVTTCSVKHDDTSIDKIIEFECISKSKGREIILLQLRYEYIYIITASDFTVAGFHLNVYVVTYNNQKFEIIKILKTKNTLKPNKFIKIKIFHNKNNMVKYKTVDSGGNNRLITLDETNKDADSIDSSNMDDYNTIPTTVFLYNDNGEVVTDGGNPGFEKTVLSPAVFKDMGVIPKYSKYSELIIGSEKNKFNNTYVTIKDINYTTIDKSMIHSNSDKGRIAIVNSLPNTTLLNYYITDTDRMSNNHLSSRTIPFMNKDVFRNTYNKDKMFSFLQTDKRLLSDGKTVNTYTKNLLFSYNKTRNKKLQEERDFNTHINISDALKHINYLDGNLKLIVDIFLKDTTFYYPSKKGLKATLNTGSVKEKDAILDDIKPSPNDNFIKSLEGIKNNYMTFKDSEFTNTNYKNINDNIDKLNTEIDEIKTKIYSTNEKILKENEEKIKTYEDKEIEYKIYINLFKNIKIKKDGNGFYISYNLCEAIIKKIKGIITSISNGDKLKIEWVTGKDTSYNASSSITIANDASYNNIIKTSFGKIYEGTLENSSIRFYKNGESWSTNSNAQQQIEMPKEVTKKYFTNIIKFAKTATSESLLTPRKIIDINTIAGSNSQLEYLENICNMFRLGTFIYASNSLKTITENITKLIEKDGDNFYNDSPIMRTVIKGDYILCVSGSGDSTKYEIVRIDNITQERYGTQRQLDVKPIKTITSGEKEIYLLSTKHKINNFSFDTNSFSLTIPSTETRIHNELLLIYNIMTLIPDKKQELLSIYNLVLNLDSYYNLELPIQNNTLELRSKARDHMKILIPNKIENISFNKDKGITIDTDISVIPNGATIHLVKHNTESNIVLILKNLGLALEEIQKSNAFKQLGSVKTKEIMSKINTNKNELLKLERENKFIKDTMSAHDNLKINTLCKDKATRQYSIILMIIKFIGIDNKLDEHYEIDIYKTAPEGDYRKNEITKIKTFRDSLSKTRNEIPIEKNYGKFLKKYIEEEYEVEIKYVSVYDNSILTNSPIADFYYSIIKNYIQETKLSDIQLKFDDFTVLDIERHINYKFKIGETKIGGVTYPQYIIFDYLVDNSVASNYGLSNQKDSKGNVIKKNVVPKLFKNSNVIKTSIRLTELDILKNPNMSAKTYTNFILTLLNNVVQSGTSCSNLGSLEPSKIKTITKKKCPNLSLFFRTTPDDVVEMLYLNSNNVYTYTAFGKNGTERLITDNGRKKAGNDIVKINKDYKYFYLNDVADICFLDSDNIERVCFKMGTKYNFTSPKLYRTSNVIIGENKKSICNLIPDILKPQVIIATDKTAFNNLRPAVTSNSPGLNDKLDATIIEFRIIKDEHTNIKNIKGKHADDSDKYCFAPRYSGLDLWDGKEHFNGSIATTTGKKYDDNIRKLLGDSIRSSSIREKDPTSICLSKGSGDPTTTTTTSTGKNCDLIDVSTDDKFARIIGLEKNIQNILKKVEALTARAPQASADRKSIREILALLSAPAGTEGSIKDTVEDLKTDITTQLKVLGKKVDSITPAMSEDLENKINAQTTKIKALIEKQTGILTPAISGNKRAIDNLKDTIEGWTEDIQDKLNSIMCVQGIRSCPATSQEGKRYAAIRKTENSIASIIEVLGAKDLIDDNGNIKSGSKNVFTIQKIINDKFNDLSSEIGSIFPSISDEMGRKFADVNSNIAEVKKDTSQALQDLNRINDNVNKITAEVAESIGELLEKTDVDISAESIAGLMAQIKGQLLTRVALTEEFEKIRAQIDEFSAPGFIMGGKGGESLEEIAKKNEMAAEKSRMNEINDKLINVLQQISTGYVSATQKSDLEGQLRNMVEVLKKKQGSGSNDNVAFLQKLLLTTQMQMNNLTNKVSNKNSNSGLSNDFDRSLATPHLPTITQFKPEGTSNIFSPLIDIKTNSKEDNNKFMDAFEKGFDKGLEEGGTSNKSTYDMSKTYVDDKDVYLQTPRNQKSINKFSSNLDSNYYNQNTNQNSNQNSNRNSNQNSNRNTNKNSNKNPPAYTGQENTNKLGMPGYSYLDPKYFNMPQKRAPVCIDTPQGQRGENSADPAGYMWGGNSNLMEFHGVGSILPKFEYKENKQNIPDKTNRI